jgi:hypothetical protein
MKTMLSIPAGSVYQPTLLQSPNDNFYARIVSAHPKDRKIDSLKIINKSWAGILLCCSFFLSGCEKPPEDKFPAFGFSIAEVERGTELISTEDQQALLGAFTAAQNAIHSNRSDDAPNHLMAAADIFRNLPENSSTIAFGMNLATALDRDLLVLQLGKGGEVWGQVPVPANPMWNMTCDHPTTTCVVHRGRWCKVYKHNGQPAGCFSGAMPNAP